MPLPSFEKMQFYIQACEHREIPNPKSGRGLCKLVSSHFGEKHTHGVNPSVCAICFNKLGDKPDPDFIRKTVTNLMSSLLKGAELGFYTPEETEAIYSEISGYVIDMPTRMMILESMMRAVEQNRLSANSAESIAAAKLGDVVDELAKKETGASGTETPGA
jgi:hypothetical protein